jgi:hypothetical protein
MRGVRDEYNGPGLDDWIYWHFYCNCNQPKQLTIHGYLRLAPFLTGPRVSPLPLWRMKNYSRISSWFLFLLQLPWTTTVWRILSLASESQSYFTTGGLPFVLATSPLRLTTSYIFQLNTCGYSLYVTSSLIRGWVCRLQLLLVPASADILRSKSCGTHDHILVSQIRDSLNL